MTQPRRRYAKPEDLPPIEPVRDGEECACRPEIVRATDGVVVQYAAQCLLHFAVRPKPPRRQVSNAAERRANHNRSQRRKNGWTPDRNS